MISIFKRQEEKFLITLDEYVKLQKIISDQVPQDSYGKYLVQSLYFDTDKWDIIRASIEKPVFKEKLRLRCYNIPSCNSTIYLELKKKYKGIVHKRRIDFPLEMLRTRNAREIAKNSDSQMGREMNFYLKAYPVSEKVHISYNREAFAHESGLRITFDTNIHFRTDKLDYENPEGGRKILPDNIVVMEIKTLGGMPMWLARNLSEFHIYPSSFSKYGTGYKKYILDK